MSMISHNSRDWANALEFVLALARQDHDKGLSGRNGADLIERIGGLNRMRHRRVLSHVYNQFRLELKTPLDK